MWYKTWVFCTQKCDFLCSIKRDMLSKRIKIAELYGMSCVQWPRTFLLVPRAPFRGFGWTIVFGYVCPSVRLSVCLSVRLSVDTFLLTHSRLYFLTDCFQIWCVGSLGPKDGSYLIWAKLGQGRGPQRTLFLQNRWYRKLSDVTTLTASFMGRMHFWYRFWLLMSWGRFLFYMGQIGPGIWATADFVSSESMI